MTISDSLPIQFWDVNDETHNEKAICGLAKQDCYCQPIQCDDEIVLQFQNSAPISVQIVSSDDVVIETIRLSQETTNVWGGSFVPGDLLSPEICDEFIQLRIVTSPDLLSEVFSNLNSWSQSATLSMTGANGAGLNSNPGTLTWSPSYPYANSGTINDFVFTKWLMQSITFPAGTYTFTLGVEVFTNNTIFEFVLGNGSSNAVFILNGAGAAGENPGATSGITYTVGFHTMTVTLTFVNNYSYIAIRAHKLGGSSTSSAKIRYIYVDSSIPVTTLAKSDCIDIRTTHECTELIEYSNSSDFDGLVYGGNSSPDATYYLRVPAQFYQEKNPQEQEDLELSNGQIVTIRQSIQEKRLLELGFMPGYMHRKLQKVLMHETITIDGDQWKRRDAYEDSPVKKYNLKRASVWLTKYDSVEKNTI